MIDVNAGIHHCDFDALTGETELGLHRSCTDHVQGGEQFGVKGGFRGFRHGNGLHRVNVLYTGQSTDPDRISHIHHRYRKTVEQVCIDIILAVYNPCFHSLRAKSTLLGFNCINGGAFNGRCPIKLYEPAMGGFIHHFARIIRCGNWSQWFDGSNTLCVNR